MKTPQFCFFLLPMRYNGEIQWLQGVLRIMVSGSPHRPMMDVIRVVQSNAQSGALRNMTTVASAYVSITGQPLLMASLDIFVAISVKVARKATVYDDATSERYVDMLTRLSNYLCCPQYYSNMRGESFISYCALFLIKYWANTFSIN